MYFQNVVWPSMAMSVSRAHTELGFLGGVGYSKFKRLPTVLIVFVQWTVTATFMRVILYISKDKYYYWFSKFYIFPLCRLSTWVDIENLESCSLFLVLWTMTTGPNMLYFTKLKKELECIPNSKNSKKFTSCWFKSLLKQILYTFVQECITTANPRITKPSACLMGLLPDR